MKTQEIECRFLDIDKQSLIKKLIKHGAKDCGETTLDETIIYDSEFKWRDERRFIRLRKVNNETKLTYKNHSIHTVDGTYEIELEIDDHDKAELFLEKIGFIAFRKQQKRRHTFQLDGVTFDIDTWPRIPSYVELEGESEIDLKKVAKKVGLNWKDADFHDARWVIENIYKIPVGELRWFTFDRFE